MPVRCACPHCGSSSPVPEFLLGRAVRCPDCKKMFDAPAAERPTDAAPVADDRDDVPVVRVPAPAGYRSGDFDDEPRSFVSSVPWVALAVSGLLLMCGLVAVAFFGFVVTSRSVVVATPAIPTPAQVPIAPPLGPDNGPVGTAPIAITGAEAAPPEPRTMTERLAGNDEDLDTLTVQAVTLPNNPNRYRFGGPRVLRNATTRGSNQPIRDVLWSSDGKSFVVLSAFDEVYRISYPELKAVRGIELGQEAEGLQRCAKGLVVAIPALEQVWLLNADTLRVEQRKQFHGLHTVVSAPDLPYSLVLCGSRNTGATKAVQAIVRFDWATEEMTPLDVSDVPLYPGFGLPNPARPALAPDGATLYACDADGRLAAFTIAGDKVTLRESAPFACGGELIPLVLSADGKHLLGPSGNEASPTMSVVATADLQKVLCSPNGRGQGHPAGFNAAGTRVFTHTAESPLAEFDLSGERVATHSLGAGRPAGTWGLAYAAHPNGKALLMLTTTELLLIEWTK